MSAPSSSSKRNSWRMRQRYLLVPVAAMLVSQTGTDGQAFTGQSLETYLVDMNTDPYEKNDLLRAPTDATDQLLARMQERIAYWRQKVGPVETPTADLKKQTWKRAGGIVPWVENEVSPRGDTAPAVKYASPSAPNIVFILIDDWGYNDIGYQSSWLTWTTPTIDRLASQGIKLTNYWTSCLCAPSRGSLMTGRYPFRLGLSEEKAGGELPLAEVTLAEELKSAGYRTYLVGKWHLGMSSTARLPTHRGFDYFYGYLNGFVDYWTKEYSGYLDLQNGDELETDPALISADLHNAYLMSCKTVDAINTHATTYKTQPMFLYAALQLIHEDWAAPQVFIDRCNEGGASADRAVYCAMNIMVDEVVANITCALNANGMADNTVLILASDNGGVQTMPGNNFPLKGSKGSFFRGGLSAPAFIHGSLVPTALQGTSYAGEVHVTDWFPTLMGLATGYQWKGGLYGQEIDGIDMWPTIKAGAPSPRTEIVHYVDEYGNCSLQLDMVKFDYNYFVANTWQSPEYVFSADQRADLSSPLCNVPSLVDFVALPASDTSFQMKEAALEFRPAGSSTTTTLSTVDAGPPTKKPTGRATGSPVASSATSSAALQLSAPALSGPAGPAGVASPAATAASVETVALPASVEVASLSPVPFTSAAPIPLAASDTAAVPSQSPPGEAIPIPTATAAVPPLVGTVLATGPASTSSASSSVPPAGLLPSQAVGLLPALGSLPAAAAAAPIIEVPPASATSTSSTAVPPLPPPPAALSGILETTATAPVAPPPPLLVTSAQLSATPALASGLPPPLMTSVNPSLPSEGAVAPAASTAVALPAPATTAIVTASPSTPEGAPSVVVADASPADSAAGAASALTSSSSSTTGSSSNSGSDGGGSPSTFVVSTVLPNPASTAAASSSASTTQQSAVASAFLGQAAAITSSSELITANGRVIERSPAKPDAQAAATAQSAKEAASSSSASNNVGQQMAIALICVAGLTFLAVSHCTSRPKRRPQAVPRDALDVVKAADTDRIASPYGSCERDALLCENI